MFLDKVNGIYSLNRKNTIKVNAPFMRYSKEKVIETGINLQVDFRQTHTCYEGTDPACGECVSCAARIKGFIDNKAIDPIKYSRTIPWAQFGCKPLTYLT